MQTMVDAVFTKLRASQRFSHMLKLLYAIQINRRLQINQRMIFLDFRWYQTVGDLTATPAKSYHLFLPTLIWIFQIRYAQRCAHRPAYLPEEYWHAISARPAIHSMRGAPERSTPDANAPHRSVEGANPHRNAVPRMRKSDSP